MIQHKIEETAQRQTYCPIGEKAGIKGRLHILIASQDILNRCYRCVKQLKEDRIEQKADDLFDNDGISSIEQGDLRPVGINKDR